MSFPFERPRLGAADPGLVAAAAEVNSLLAESATTLRGLGQGTERQRDDAFLAYSLIVKQIPATIASLKAIRPADWEERVTNASKMFDAWFTSYKNEIHGKTGDPEYERKLSNLLIDVNREIISVLRNRPSILAMAADQAARYLSGFAQGVSEAFDGYLAWMKGKAEEAVKKWYEANVLIRTIKKSLAAGKYSADKVADVKSRLAQAEAVMTSFRVMSFAGTATLDYIAQDTYGPYPSLGFAWTPAVILAVGVVAVGLILALGIVFKILGPIGESPGTLLGVAAAVVVAVVVLPSIFGSK